MSRKNHQESWKNIPGYEGLYQVSNLGQIKSLVYCSNISIVQIKDIINMLYVGYKQYDIANKFNLSLKTINKINKNSQKYLNKQMLLKFAIDRHSYTYVILCKNKNRKKCMIHKLVLATFVGPCPIDMESRHLNGIRHDNRLMNLRYGTKKENMSDKILHGTNYNIPKGSQCPWSKVTEKILSISDFLSLRM